MFIGVIHSEKNTERYERLIRELEGQGITDYHIFPGIHDITSVKKGINLAHKSVVEYAMEAGFDEVCVMEDDLKATHKDSWKYFIENKPKDFDIYLSGIYMGVISKSNTVEKFCGFHCYIVSQRFYETFLSTEDDAHIDMSLAGLGKFVVCNPFAFIQYNGFSNNTGKVENYDPLLNGRNLYNGTVF